MTPGTATTSHSTVNPSTTLLDCKDDNGQTFCDERKHKCDKQHIMEKCQKTCGLCPTTLTYSTKILTAPTTTTSSTTTIVILFVPNYKKLTIYIRKKFEPKALFKRECKLMQV